MVSAQVRSGMFVDPFVATPGYSCAPNAWCVFDGKIIQVKAARDISIGDEITLAYLSENDYKDHTAELKSRRGYHLHLLSVSSRRSQSNKRAAQEPLGSPLETSTQS